jgi:membrane associated rhomboid family serine protease/Tfp pilus assembly protein PilF
MSDAPIIVAHDSPERIYDVPRRVLPVATLVILSINVVMYVLMELSGGSQNPEVLLDFGASYGPYLRHGEYWRLVMPMFLHIGLLHLLIDGFALFITGSILESVYGYGRFALVYVASGMGGSLLSMLLSNRPGGGASGAIFGIMGALLVLTYWRREAVSPRWARAIRRGIVPTIIFNLVIGFFIPFIDKWAHVGGLLSGIVLGWLIPPPARGFDSTGELEKPSQAVVFIPLVVVALAMSSTASNYRTAKVVTHLLQEGARYRALRQPDQALSSLREAARRAPGDERAHMQLGSLYLEKKQIDEAVREYTEALRLNPELAEAELGLAVAYRQKGDLAKAQAALEALLKKFPATAPGQVTLADLCAQQKLYPEAIERYEAALKLQPDFAVAHNNLAWLYATSEDGKFRNPPSALEHAERAVALTQWKEPMFIDTLAEALYANGKFGDAVKVQTKALELDPRNSELQEHMARYRKAAGA